MNKSSNDWINFAENISLLSDGCYNYFNVDAVFSDETENYRTYKFRGLNKSTIVKLRTGHNNCDAAFICCDGEKMKMSKKSSENRFDYFETEIIHLDKTVYYYFEIIYSGKRFFYNKNGISLKNDPAYNFIIIPDFKTPDWAKGTVMYQIYVDRFYNADKTNDVVNNEYAYLGRAAKKIEDWDSPVEKDDICNFYGGDLKGVMEKMDYLKNLGVEVIYFNPIFVSPSNHKYDIQDYDYIDPHYGVIVNDGGEPLYFEKFANKFATMYMQRTTNKENLEASNRLFQKLVELAHKNGIKVILDGVFNHCGAFNKWLDKEGFYQMNGYPQGAYSDKKSIYHNYFKWYSDNWPNNDAYDGWWGHDNHPKLNYENSPALYNYIMEIGKKWVSPPFNADGWRLDVAADLGCSPEFNHKFWRDFRKAVKKANPNAVIYAEHYGDASSWLTGDQWDSVMNYDAFMEPISWFLTGLEKHSDEYRHDLYCNAQSFESAMRYHMSKFSFESLSISMNELSNHDHSRFLTRTNKTAGRLNSLGSERASEGINKGIMKEAIAFQMTWIGSPTIYYGDEAGVCGWTDPDNRRTYPWGNEDKDILSFYKEMIKIHKKYSALKCGSTEYLYTDYGIIGYGRWNSKEKIIVVLNNNCTDKTIQMPVWRIGVNDNSKLSIIISSDENGFTMPNKSVISKNGHVSVSIPAYGSIVAVEKNK